MGSDYICKCPSGIKGRHCEIGELRQKALINYVKIQLRHEIEYRTTKTKE